MNSLKFQLETSHPSAKKLKTNITKDRTMKANRLFLEIRPTSTEEELAKVKKSKRMTKRNSPKMNLSNRSKSKVSMSTCLKDNQTNQLLLVR